MIPITSVKKSNNVPYHMVHINMIINNTYLCVGRLKSCFLILIFTIFFLELFLDRYTPRYTSKICVIPYQYGTSFDFVMKSNFEVIIVSIGLYLIEFSRFMVLNFSKNYIKVTLKNCFSNLSKPS